jgi:uncharacterized protein YhhL (DUF1145 family)
MGFNLCYAFMFFILKSTLVVLKGYTKKRYKNTMTENELLKSSILLKGIFIFS